MTRDEAFGRLTAITAALVELHNTRATAAQGLYLARSRALEQGFASGLSATAARDSADSSTVQLRNQLVGLEGEIAGYVEERDHIRFLIDHGAIT